MAPIKPNNLQQGKTQYIVRRDDSWQGVVRRFGWPFVEFAYNLGSGARFAWPFFFLSGSAFRRPSLIVRQLRIIGAGTSLIILVSGFLSVLF